MVVSKKWGYPHSWMVYKKKAATKMDDLGVYPSSGNPHMMLIHAHVLTCSRMQITNSICKFRCKVGPTCI